MKIDLHNHSLYSDGINTLIELSEKAKNNQVDIFALTDHDSVLGLLNIPLEIKNIVIPGIELSTTANGESVHLVGLFKNGIIPEGVINFSRDFLEKRKQRAILMAKKIEEIYNVKMNMEDLIKDSNIRAITRGNMLRNIRNNNDITLKEAEFYISNKSEAYIPMSKTSVKDGIEFLHENNCLVILAHPTLLKKETFEMIKDLDFDGIEARYPLNKNGDEYYFKEYAKQKGIFYSAGSDCHGDDSHSDIGTSTLNKDEFLDIAFKLGYDVEEKKWK